MDTKDRTIEKQKEIIEVLKNHCTMPYVIHCMDYIKVTSELSALTEQGEKEKNNIELNSNVDINKSKVFRIYCPNCLSSKVSYNYNTNTFTCKDCGKSWFNVK